MPRKALNPEIRVEQIGAATLYCGDCRDILPALDKVDAVVTDPPYGLGEAAGANKSRVGLVAARDYGNASWDDAPIDDELLGMVREAGRWNIIFGGNYYALPATTCWLVWDKENGCSHYADCELAWTNLDKAVRQIRYRWNGMIRANNEPRGDHPTQKPVGVMKWVIGHLPVDAETILDPFMGSGSTGVAAMRDGRQFIGIEREPDYFDIACKRIEDAQAQADLFIAPAKPAAIEQTAFDLAGEA